MSSVPRRRTISTSTMASKRAALGAWTRPARSGLHPVTLQELGIRNIAAIAAPRRHNCTLNAAAPPVTQRPANLKCNGLQNHRRLYATAGQSQALRNTALYDLHVKHGGKMVPFGGFSMPVQYSDLGIGQSHNWTREKASLFDVSHMVQHEMSGPGAEAFLSTVTPSSVKTLKPNHSTLSCLLHPGSGGIVDDSVITRLDNGKFYFVTNAACRDKDLEYIEKEISTFQKAHPDQTIDWKVLDDRGLIALQGPLAAEILSSVLAAPESTDLNTVYFGQCRPIQIKTTSGSTVDVLASRGGYTGEDGFEISIPNSSSTVAVTETLLDTAGQGKLRLAGLGARDSLRLEAGMCLYGHDLDDTTTPVEGALAWVVAKDRRAEGGFHGAETILAQLKPKSKGGQGVSRRRVGFVVEGAPAREGATIVDESGSEVGKVTSGCPSPTLGKHIAMGYVKDGLHKSGTELFAVVRGKQRKAVVAKMPFVETKYHKGP